MRQAVENRVAAVNENLANLRKVKPDKNDPMSSLMALSGALMGDSKLYVGAFQKLGAEKAQGKPGYMCDYMLQLRAEGGGGAMMDSMMRLGGSLCTARFVNDNGVWVWITPNDERR